MLIILTLIFSSSTYVSTKSEKIRESSAELGMIQSPHLVPRREWV
jgi:hypothetical protein